jgi:hypothetical protein
MSDEFAPLRRMYQCVREGGRIDVGEINGRRVYKVQTRNGTDVFYEDEIVDLLKKAEMDMQIDLAISERMLEKFMDRYATLLSSRP